MKHLIFLAAIFLCSAVISAAPLPGFNWTLFWSGSWEENRTLYNRGELRLIFSSPGLVLRSGLLDRRPMNFELGPPQGESWSAIWGNPERHITNFTAGLYHRQTGSRILFGILDEWGLPARIRNPWIRSAPYPENRRPIIADLKTTASSTKEDEVYLYLSSPFLNLSSDIRTRGFIAFQTEIEDISPALSGGLDFTFASKTGLFLETFHTWATLSSTKSNTWFSDRPPLPERDFRLSSVGFIFSSPLVLVSSDLAYSQTFAWGEDIYGNFGICLSPLLPFGSRPRPLSFSFAVDGSGDKFVYRDGLNHGAGLRTAGKIEWKGSRNSLFRVNTVLRDFNRSFSGIYYRHSTRNAASSAFRLTRVSFFADRNASNTEKISDGFSGNLGFSIFVPQMAKNGHFGVNFSGSLKGLTSLDGKLSPYPRLDKTWGFETASAACELTWSPQNFQLRTKLGYSIFVEKEEKLDFSLSGTARFRNGRLSLKAATVDFTEKWNWTLSWRLERR